MTGAPLWFPVDLVAPLVSVRRGCWVLPFLLGLLLAGCGSAGVPGHRALSGSSSPARPWLPPREPLPGAPDSGLALPAPASLAEVLAIGLARHPETRAAWLAAQVTAASLAETEGRRWPTLDALATLGTSRSLGSGGAPVTRTSVAAGLELSWLLLDCGGRAGEEEVARQALLAASWTHASLLGDRILLLAQRYHAQQAAAALLEGERALRDLARATVEAAQQRRRSGITSLAEELQAVASLQRVELQLATLEAELLTSRAQLAGAAGLPVTAAFELPPLPPLDDAGPLTAQVETVLAEAVAQRPELAAAEAAWRAAEARLAVTAAAGRPSLALGGSLLPTHLLEPEGDLLAGGLTLTFRWPLLRGGSQQAREEGARLAVEVARARWEAVRSQVALEAFASLQGLRLAAARLTGSRELLATSEQAVEMALGRFRAGAGSLLELLAAQSALEEARRTQIEARGAWLTALARLARDRGSSLAAAPLAATPEEVAP